jgi:UDP:flavonoid glycosyltransferase YjiC (YdhE family)
MEMPLVLVCPMDWGLGHASRCVPVILALREAGCSVLVAASGGGSELIKSELGPEIINLTDPDGDSRVRIIPFPGFPVSYSRRFLFFRLMLRVPAFLYHIHMERKLLNRIVKKYRPNLIVSDNRYGLGHRSVRSVIITHQLTPVMPLALKPFEGIVALTIRKWIRTFDECWIPDDPDHSAAGQLISGFERLPSVYFIGWLSRFGSCGYGGSFRYRFLFILSGPEPNRTMLEDIIIKRFSGIRERVLLVRGLHGCIPEREVKGNIEIVGFMDSDMLATAVNDSRTIVCRSGYSSVMDLLVMGRDAVLIPTPGQTEQEYLAEWLSAKGWFRAETQDSINPDIDRDLKADQVSFEVRDLLRERIDSVVKMIREERSEGDEK